MLQIQQERFEQVTQAAFDAAQGSQRWQTAIVKAKQIAESNPYIHFDGSTMLLLSDSNEIYEVTDGHCPCKAFAHGQPFNPVSAQKGIRSYVRF